MNNYHNIHCYFKPDLTRGIVSAITSFSHYSLESGGVGAKSTFSNWAIEYHSKYAGKIFLNESQKKQIDRKQNTVHLFAPGCIRKEDNRKADFPIKEMFFFFDGAEKYKIDKLVSPEYQFAQFYDPNRLVGRIFDNMIEYCKILGPEAFLMVQGLMLQIIFLLKRSQKIDSITYEIAPIDTEPQISFSRKVEQYMWKRLAKTTTIADIAAYMKTSESTLCHRFKQETGRSPINRHIELKIEFAKQLLMKGERLKNIAQLTGFCDEYHFSKRFKSVTGMSPTKFREQF